MTMDPMEIVNAWVEAANAQDTEGLIALSDPQIEIVGPRGSGFGHQLLRDWLARAGLTLETLRRFAHDSSVVLEQRGVWRSMETGEISGDAVVASAFEVNGQRVVKFARFDSLDDALRAAGLSPSDEIA